MEHDPESILAGIDADKLVQLLSDLIDINSPTGEEEECARFFAGHLNGLGMQARLQQLSPGRANAVGVLRGRGGGRSLMLFGHLDTTLAGRPEEDYAVAGVLPPGHLPQAYVRDGQVFGLGSYNMKGGVACAAAAVDAVRRSGVELRGDVIVAGVAGESEKSSVDGLYRSFRGPRYEGAGYGARLLLQQGMIPDCAIECEPSNGYVLNAWTGYCRVKLVLHGKTGYQSHNGGSISALQQAVKAIGAIEAWADGYTAEHTYDSQLGKVTPYVNIGAIEGGAPYFPSLTPAVCNLYVEVRTAPHQSATAALAALRSVLDGVADADPSFRYELDVYGCKLPGTETPASADVVTAVLAARAQVMGRQQDEYPPEEAVASGDGTFLRLNGIPVANCGPGGSMWGPEGESQRIEQLVAVTKIYVLSILDLCSRQRGSVPTS